MNYKNFNSLINLSGIIFEPIDWDEQEFSKLDDFILECENNFEEEMNQNFLGKNFIEKEDIIKIYFSRIADIHYEIFCINFDNEDEDKDGALNKIALDKIKETYQYIIDIICNYSLNDGINLLKIFDNEFYAVLNIDSYNDRLRELQIKKGTKSAKLKSEFYSDEGYELFEYLIDNFGADFTNHNKSSCIYRMMIDDELIRVTLKPEEFRNIISLAPYNITFDFFMLSKDKLSKKVIKRYNLIKSNYFDAKKT